MDNNNKLWDTFVPLNTYLIHIRTVKSIAFKSQWTGATFGHMHQVGIRGAWYSWETRRVPTRVRTLLRVTPLCLITGTRTRQSVISWRWTVALSSPPPRATFTRMGTFCPLSPIRPTTMHYTMECDWLTQTNHNIEFNSKFFIFYDFRTI